MNRSKINLLGWVGTGILGSAIVTSLLKAKLDLLIYNRTISKMKDLLAQGARQAENISHLFLNCEIIFVCLGSEDAFNETILSNIDSLNRSYKPITIVDLSTISPQLAVELCKKLKKYNITYIESPVSGGKEGALNCVMTAICAGDKKKFEVVKKILGNFCSNIHYVGESGNAQKIKIINNLAESINLFCASEVVLLGIKLGFDIKTLRAVLTTARGKSAYMNLLLDRLYQKQEDVAVSLDIRTKDLALAKALLDEVKIEGLLSYSTIDFFKRVKEVYGSAEDQTKCFELLNV